MKRPAGILFLILVYGLACADGLGQEKGNGSFTLYYIAEVKNPEEVKTGGVELKLKDGTVKRYRLAPADMKKANMQGTVVKVNPDTGKRTTANFIQLGKWVELPGGWEGSGNRMNPITSYRTVAADQSIHPYGSRVLIPGVVGYKTPDGQVLDGYFWVGDVGKAIKGKFRFDVFVGDEPIYWEIMHTDGGKWKAPVEVDRIPSAPKGMSPRTDSGVEKILEGLGYDLEIPAEELIQSLDLSRAVDSSLDAALTDFQEQHPQIPAVEYGMARAPVTTWFLTQAATAIASGKKYPIGPSGPEQPEDQENQEDLEPDTGE